MRIVPNAGTDQVIDSVMPCLQAGAAIDVITPEPSQFAFGELREQLQRLAGGRMVLSRPPGGLTPSRLRSPSTPPIENGCLPPATVGIPAFVDDAREYLEIAVIAVTVRDQANPARLANLVHRAIPYPVLLVLQDEHQVGLSAVHKRRSLGEAGKVVLDDEVVWRSIDDTADAAWLPAFLDALALGRLPRTSVLTLYQGWIDMLVALAAARLTGTFSLLASAPEAGARRAATTEYKRTETEIGRVRQLAARETQVSRQVELNQQLARLRAALSEPRTKL